MYKKGDLVVCTNATYYTNSLTEGKVYTVSRDHKGDYESIWLVCDSGLESNFYASRFSRHETVKEEGEYFTIAVTSMPTLRTKEDVERYAETQARANPDHKFIIAKVVDGRIARLKIAYEMETGK